MLLSAFQPVARGARTGSLYGEVQLNKFEHFWGGSSSGHMGPPWQIENITILQLSMGW